MHPSRLRRLDQVFGRDHVYFITACTANRQRILSNPEIHRAFIQFASKSAEHGIYVGRYVLMTDHIHLFIATTTEVRSLSQWMKSLKNMLAKTLRQSGVAAPHWQKGFFDHVLRSEESYTEKWEYVARNPVRAGLAAKIEDWPHQGEIHQLDCRWLRRSISADAGASVAIPLRVTPAQVVQSPLDGRWERARSLQVSHHVLEARFLDPDPTDVPIPAGAAGPRADCRAPTPVPCSEARRCRATSTRTDHTGQSAPPSSQDNRTSPSPDHNRDNAMPAPCALLV